MICKNLNPFFLLVFEKKKMKMKKNEFSLSNDYGSKIDLRLYWLYRPRQKLVHYWKHYYERFLLILELTAVLRNTRQKVQALKTENRTKIF